MSLKDNLASWLARAPRASAPADAEIAEIAALRVSADAWKQKAGQKSRRVLSTHVLRQIFNRRVRTLPARVAIPSRERREAVLREVSPAYVAAVEQGPSVWGEHVHAMRVSGLQWWMPVVRPQPGGPSAAWIAKQRFPYRALTQTRELAVGGIMLDVGANIGRMSIPRIVLGDIAAAYCAEPDPLNYACLVGNIVDNGLNGLLLPDRLAISDRDGSALLHRADVSGGHHVLAENNPARDALSGPLPQPSKGEFVDVPCLTLDTWLGRLRVDLDAVTFVKVDVQGYEMRVLQGASALLAKGHAAWQLELDPALLMATGTSLADVCAKLQQHFTYFIDMNGALTGPRQRMIQELPDGLAYLTDHEKTDVLVYCASR